MSRRLFAAKTLLPSPHLLHSGPLPPQGLLPLEGEGGGVGEALLTYTLQGLGLGELISYEPLEPTKAVTLHLVRTPTGLPGKLLT